MNQPRLTLSFATLTILTGCLGAVGYPSSSASILPARPESRPGPISVSLPLQSDEQETSALSSAVRASARRMDLAATLAWLDADKLMHTEGQTERATMSAALLVARADLDLSRRRFLYVLDRLITTDTHGDGFPQRAVYLRPAGFAGGGRGGQSILEYFARQVWDSVEYAGDAAFRMTESDSVPTLAEAVRQAEQADDLVVDARQTASLAFAGILRAGELTGIRYVPGAFQWSAGAYRPTEFGNRFAAKGDGVGSGEQKALTLDQLRSTASRLFPALMRVDGNPNGVAFPYSSDPIGEAAGQANLAVVMQARPSSWSTCWTYTAPDEARM